jgi:hypothetical protein
MGDLIPVNRRAPGVVYLPEVKAAGLAIVLWIPADGGMLFDILAPGFGGIRAGVLPMPSPVVSALVLFAGLLVYVTGLFAPFGRRSGT